MLETIIIILMIFNFTYTAYVFKQVYQEHKEHKNIRNKTKQELQDKKLVLNRTLQDLKSIDFNQPLYAKMTIAETNRLLKVTQMLKEENHELFVFASELLKNVKVENMRNFMKNAPYITINHHSLSETNISNGQIKAGSYYNRTKEIDVYVDDNSTLYHELLHAASADFNYETIGFSALLEQAGQFGKGLNEGYTELLNERFFNNQSSQVYSRLQQLAQLIELFYENKEDMVTDYFNADIFDLIGELLKSMTLEEAIDIIVDMDLFLDYDNITTIDYLKYKQKVLKLLKRAGKNDTDSKSLVKSIFKSKPNS